LNRQAPFLLFKPINHKHWFNIYDTTKQPVFPDTNLSPNKTV